MKHAILQIRENEDHNVHQLDAESDEDSALLTAIYLVIPSLRESYNNKCPIYKICIITELVPPYKTAAIRIALKRPI